MIRWGASQYLVALVAVPLVAVLMLVGAWLKRRSLARLADRALVPRLTDSKSPRLAALKAGCLLVALALMILAAARPQWGEKLQVYKGRGIDIVVALDASKSMLATDVKPDRLTRAKTQIASLLSNLNTNRVGIVAFAGEAQVMCPLTTDVEAAKLFLDIIDPDNMPKPGTNIQHAVEAAASMFDPSDETSKALVLVTDGDNLDGDPAATTRLAMQQRIRIFAVGVGTLEGSTIPEAHGVGTTYLKDPDDKIVVSRLAERLLLVMAKATDGRYFRSETINLNNLVLALDQIQKKSIEGGEFVEYEERYQLFLLAALMFAFAGVLISDRRGAWFPATLLPWLGMRRRDPRLEPAAGAAARTALVLVVLALAVPARAEVGSSMRRGLALEKQGKLEEAIKAYQEALVLEPDNVRIHYDIGRAMHQLKKQPEAIDQFQLGLLSKQKALRANSLYNMANSQYRQDKLDEAIAGYTQALLLDPKDLQAKQNLEFCWKEKAERKSKPDSTQKQQPKGQPQQQPGQQQPQQVKQGESQQGQIGKDQADRMLQALQNREKENLKKQPKKPQPKAAGGKDW